MSNVSSFRLDMPDGTTAVADAASLKTSRKKVQGKFLRGPIPLDWLQRASVLPGRALQFGVALWYLDGFEQTGTVRAAPGCIRDFVPDRHASYRALRALEKTGLVSVKRRKGAAPLVTLVTS